MTDSNTYCLFCRSGQEGHVIQRLSDMGYATLAPRVKHWKGGQGNGASGERRLLLPGYVFFERDPSSGLPEGADPDWNSIRRISGVIRILEYQNGQRALRDSDLCNRLNGYILSKATAMILLFKITERNHGIPGTKLASYHAGIEGKRSYYQRFFHTKQHTVFNDM